MQQKGVAVVAKLAATVAVKSFLPGCRSARGFEVVQEEVRY